jgi:hypothetical protein
MVGTTYQTPAIQQSPDGSILATRDGLYVDRNGAKLRTGSTSTYYTSVLADDNRSLCEIRPSGSAIGEQWVFMGRVDGAARRIAQAGVTAGRTSLAILACSPLNDRVVVGDLGMTGVSGIRVFALSSGRLQYQRAYSAPNTGVISSHDGKFLAEQASTYDAQGQPLPVVSTIRRTSDGQVVARVTTQRVLRFSWDDMRLVTAPFFQGQGPADVQLIDWHSGKTLWHLVAAGGGAVYAMAQPNGPNMAIAVAGQVRSGDVDQLWLVAADGQATQVINEVFYPAYNAGF